MFTTGMPLTGQLFYMYATMLIAVPTGVKIFNWLATMWRGAMTFETPMLFSIGFIVVFTWRVDWNHTLSCTARYSLHDTYYVVAHSITCWLRGHYLRYLREYITGYLNGLDTCMTRD